MDAIVGLVGNVLVFVILVVVLVAFALRVGRSALLSLIVSLYIGYAVYAVFPFGELLGSSALANLATYGALVVVSYLVVRRLSSGAIGGFRIAPLIILCVLTGGFLMALGYTAFALDTVYDFPALLDSIFAPKEYFFWWFIAPLVGAFFLGR